jgi:hypothetical protein
LSGISISVYTDDFWNAERIGILDMSLPDRATP